MRAYGIALGPSPIILERDGLQCNLRRGQKSTARVQARHSLCCLWRPKLAPSDLVFLQGTPLIGLTLIGVSRAWRLGRRIRTVSADRISRTILVVEDEWLLRDELAHAFRADGWIVLEAATGEAAVAILRRRRIHALLTDIQLGDYLSG